MIRVLVTIITVISLNSYAKEQSKERDLALNLFRTRSTTGHFMDIVTTFKSGEYHDYYLYTLALTKTLANFKERLDFEVEGQLVRHVEDPRAYEINSLVVLRWTAFFWDSLVDTSIAMGSGFSYATKIPEFELLKNEVNSNLLHCLMAEIAIGVPFIDSLEVVLRVHHRSGFWGLFNAVWGGSNHIGFGLKYLF